MGPQRDLKGGTGEEVARGGGELQNCSELSKKDPLLAEIFFLSISPPEPPSTIPTLHVGLTSRGSCLMFSS